VDLDALITDVITRLQAAKEELPVYGSFNMRGAAEHNKDLLQKWGSINPHLQSWLRRD